MVAVAQVAVRFVQAFMLPNPGAVLESSGRSARRLRAVPDCFLTEFRWLTGGKNTPQHVVYFRQRLAKIFPGIRRPCATARSTAARQSSSALATAGTTCSGLMAKNGGNEKTSVMDWSYAQSC